MASTITFTGLNFTGTPSTDDTLAARFTIIQENKTQSQLELNPPGIQLPFDTPANIKASYLTILTNRVTALHSSNINAAKSDPGLQQGFTGSQLEQIKSNLLTRLINGESAASIVADTASL